MESLNVANINWLAVLVAGAASFILGGLWYALLFGNIWARVYGHTAEQIAAMSKHPASMYGGLIACNLAFAAGLAMLMNLTGADTLREGVMLGGAVGVLVLLPLTLATQIGGGRSLRGFLIDWGLQACALLLSGAILGAWR